MSRTRTNIPFLQRIQGESLSDLQRRASRDRQWERYYLDEVLRRARDEDMYATIVEAISSDNAKVLDDLLDAYVELGKPVNIQGVASFALQNKRYSILDSLVQRIEPRILIAAYVDNLNRRVSQPSLGILMLSSDPFFYEIGTYLAQLLSDPSSVQLGYQLVDLIFTGLNDKEVMQLLNELSSVGILTYGILDRVAPSLLGEFGPTAWASVRDLLSDDYTKQALKDITELNPVAVDTNYLPNVVRSAPQTYVGRTIRAIPQQPAVYPEFSPIRSPRSTSPPPRSPQPTQPSRRSPIARSPIRETRERSQVPTRSPREEEEEEEEYSPRSPRVTRSTRARS